MVVGKDAVQVAGRAGGKGMRPASLPSLWCHFTSRLRAVKAPRPITFDFPKDGSGEILLDDP